MSSRGHDPSRLRNADQHSQTSTHGEALRAHPGSHGHERTRKPNSPVEEAVIKELAPSNPDTKFQLLPSMTINRFTLVEQIGEGGMGLAWKAIDPSRQGPRNSGLVVLKFLKPSEQGDKAALEQSRAAFQMISKLQHTHICAVHELIEDPHVGCFQVMKYVHGLTLSQYRLEYGDSLGRVSLDKVVEFVQAAAAGLQEAHDNDVLHRDIKPDNVMIESSNDRLQLIDFGLAGDMQRSQNHSTGLYATGGTPSYMAPEQMLGEKQSAATDQYSFAVVVWELMTGKRPFAREATTSQLKAMLNDELPPSDHMPESIRSVLCKALHSHRKDRFSSIQEFATAFVAAAIVAERSTSRAEERPNRSQLFPPPPSVIEIQTQEVAKTTLPGASKRKPRLKTILGLTLLITLMVAGAERRSHLGTTDEWKLKLMGGGALEGLTIFVFTVFVWRFKNFRFGASMATLVGLPLAWMLYFTTFDGTLRDGDFLEKITLPHIVVPALSYLFFCLFEWFERTVK